MDIHLKIEKNNYITISLVDKKKVIGSVRRRESNSLSTLLLFEIDKILQKNEMGLDKISGFEIISDVPEKWTSYRIAEITLKSLVLAR